MRKCNIKYIENKKRIYWIYFFRKQINIYFQEQFFKWLLFRIQNRKSDYWEYKIKLNPIVYKHWQWFNSLT